MWVMEGVCTEEMLSFSPTSSGEAKNGKYVWMLSSPAQAQEDTGIAPQPPLRQNEKGFGVFLCLAFQGAGSCQLALVYESLCHLYLQLAGLVCLWCLRHFLQVHAHTLHTLRMVLYLINIGVSLVTPAQKRKMRDPQGSSFCEALGFHFWHCFVFMLT